MARWILGFFILLLIAFVAFLAFAPGYVESQQNRVRAHEPYEISQAARILHADLVIADLHSDTLLWGRSILSRVSRGHVDLPRLQEGNVTLQVLAAVTKVPESFNYERTEADSDQLTPLLMAQLWPPRTWNSLLQRALYQAERLESAAAGSRGRLVAIRTASDLDDLLAARAAGETVTGGLMALEGAHALEGKLENVAVLYEAGYRIIGLHHFFDNELGGSLHGTGKSGLTDFGRAVVRELESRRMIIDLAHSSPKVVDEVLEMSSRPQVVSHTGMYGACASPRNLSDQRMKRIAEKGGVIGIGYWNGAVCDISPDGVAKSIAYAVRLLGEDHVALGSDYDGSTTVAFDTSELAALTDALLRAGLSEGQIRKIMGGNLIRLLRTQLPD